MSTTPTIDPAGAADPPQSPAVTGRPTGVSRARMFTAVVLIVLFSEIAPIQTTMAATALEKIAASFPGSGTNIAWMIIMSGLVGAAAAPLIGRIGDVWGMKRTFVTCGALFAAGCLVCALADSWAVFLFGRCLQSFAVANAVLAYGLVRDLLPRKHMALGFGAIAAGFGFATAFAPLVGGWLTRAHGWRAAFWLSLGFMTVMIALVAVFVPDSKPIARQRLGFTGAVLLTFGAALVIVYVDRGQVWGWTRPASVAGLACGLALLALFVLALRRASTPLIDPRVLFQPRFGLLLAVGLLASCMIGVQTYAITYMARTPSPGTIENGIVASTLAKVAQASGVRLPPEAVQVSLIPGFSYSSGFSSHDYALRIAVLQGVITIAFGVIGAIVARKFGARLPLLSAAAVFAVIGLIEAVGLHTWDILTVTNAAFGSALGFFYTAAAVLVAQTVPQEQTCVGFGVFSLVQGVGTAIGVAVVTAFAAAHPMSASVRVAGRPPQLSPIPKVFGDQGFELGFWFATATALAALVLALVMRGSRPPVIGERTGTSAPSLPPNPAG
ncbi:MFS transporter [Nocardia sp. NPDC059091]|uniref:MFS transporter n=1 Tax=unclassified Nocardia TaxID=2637762 RepID=UPI00369A80AC